MATNKYAVSFDSLESSQAQIPGGDPTRYTSSVLSSNSAVSELLYSSALPGFLSVVAFLDAAASGGNVDIYLGPDNTYPKFMGCTFAGGDCKTPIPNGMFSNNGWSIYGNGDGTNYIHFGYNHYNAYGATSSEINNNVDTYINNTIVTQTNGSNVIMRFNNEVSNALYRCLIKFDLSTLSGISSCSSAVMQLTVESCVIDPMVYQNVLIAAVLSPWDQAQACWNNRLTGVPWNVAGLVGGSDVRSTPDWQGNINVTDEGKVGFDLTALVNDWLGGVIDNNGILIYTNYVASNQEMDWHSRDSATASARPRLNVAY